MSSLSIQKGSFVLHPQHGVGKITSIQDCSFAEQPEASYVELYFKRDQLTMTVLEDSVSGMVRGLISSEEAHDLLDHMTAWNGKPQSQWKARANANQAAIESGDPFEYSKVLKSLASLESGGAIRSSDRQHLNVSLNLLTEELACAMNKSRNRVRGLLSKAAGTSL